MPDAAPQLSILMPAYNEESTVVAAVERALAADYGVEGVEVVLVENGSTDRTREILRETAWPDSVRIVYVDQNRGKGAGVRTALAHAAGHFSVILDADLEYEPNEISMLLKPLLEGKGEAAIGTRLFQAHSAYGFWYVIGNRVINLAANMLFNAWLSDILNCLKVSETQTLRSLRLDCDDFGIDAEIVARLLRERKTIYEVPVTYTARSREGGKKLSSRDGFSVLFTLIRCRLR